jgi:hypothetical protein
VTASVRKRRRRTMLAGAVVAGSLIGLPTLGLHAVKLVKTSKAGRCAELVPITYIPATPSALLAITDAKNNVTSIALLAMKPANKQGVYSGGTVVLVPSTAKATLPDGSTGGLGDIYAAGGADALKAGVDGLLGITSNVIAVEDAAALGAQLTPLGSVPVTFLAPVTDKTADATVDNQLFAAGQATLLPAQIGTVLTAGGSTDTEELRLERARAVWLGVAARVGGGVTTTKTVTPLPTTPVTSVAVTSTSTATCAVNERSDPPAPKNFASFLAGFVSGSVNVYQLTAVPSPTPATSGAELTTIDVTEVSWLMARLIPASVSPAREGPTVFLKSAFSDVVTQAAIARILFSGANVVLVTPPPGSAPEVSTYSVTDPRYLDAAKVLTSTLGDGVREKQALTIDGVEITITLGQDFNASQEAQAATVPVVTIPVTTTTVATTTTAAPTVAPTLAPSTKPAPTTKPRKKP